ncbi:MAG: protein kinase [Planctomycetes bacterium]|nr:protein kinase [Planctomycetota bacterium]
MTISAPVLLETLREYRLLDEEQIDQLVLEVRAHGFDAESLAGELCRRRLLTYFQSSQLLAGKGADLVLGANYVLLDKLGEGGMGAVYRARHRITRGERAVKLIRSEYLTSKDSVQRFFQEAQAAEKLSHPNIIRAYDAGEDRGRCYFVMEYVEGEDLSEVLRQRGPLPVGEACEYVRQAAMGLQHAYERGLVHRDIKPSNLLLSRAEGLIKILDLGLARLRESPLQGADEANPLTPMGVMMGTPDFMAPEQAEDSRAVDIRADLYALGGTLYQLLSGSVPFPGGTLVQKLQRHFHEIPIPLTRWRPDVPEPLSAVVARMMAKRPDQRYQTPAEVAAALKPFSSSVLPSLAPPTHPKPGPAHEATPPFPPRGGSEADGSQTMRNLSGEVFSLPGVQAEATERIGQRDAAGPRPERPSRRRLVLTVTLVAAVLVPPLVWWLVSLGSGSGADEGDGGESPEKNSRTVKTQPDGQDGDTGKKPSKDKQRPPDRINPLPVKRGETKGARPSSEPMAKSKSSMLAADAGTGKGWERKPEEICQLGNGEVERVVFSANGSRAAVRRPSQIELYALGGQSRREILSPDEVARDLVQLDPVLGELTLTPDGTRGTFAATGRTTAKVRGTKQFGKSFDVLIEWGPPPRVFVGSLAFAIREVQGEKMLEPSTRCLAYTGDGKFLLDGAAKEFRLWRIKPGQPFTDSFAKYTLTDSSVAIAGAPGGQYAAVGLADSSIRLFRLDAAEDIEPSVLKGQVRDVRCVAFLGDRQLVSGDSEGAVALWRFPEQPKPAATIAPLAKLTGWYKDVIRCVVGAPDGEHFATGGRDGFVCLGQFGEKQPLWRLKCEDEVQAVAFSADGGSLFYATKRRIDRIPLRADTGKAKSRPAAKEPPGNGKA